MIETHPNLAEWPKRTLSRNLLHAFSLQRMHVDRACDGDGLNHGCVLCWHGDGDDRIGISWDWSEIMPGVISIVDPLGVRSNLLLTDDSGAPLPDMAVAIDINTLIYGLGWQQRVQSICADAGHFSPAQLG